MVQVSTAYLASSRVRARSYTTSEPVIRGCTIRRWPLDKRNTACFARRITSSMVLPRRVRSSRGFDTRRNTSVLARRARDPVALEPRGELPDDRLNLGQLRHGPPWFPATRCHAGTSFPET